MTRRSKVWLVVAGVFTAVNVGGAVYAGALGEMSHTGLHVVLSLLGAYVVWRLAPGGYARRTWARAGSAIDAPSGEHADTLTNLQQSLDAVAIEVERIGEGQRFMTRLFTEKGTPQTAAGGAAEPIEKKPPETPPPDRRD